MIYLLTIEPTQLVEITASVCALYKNTADAYPTVNSIICATLVLLAKR